MSEKQQRPKLYTRASDQVDIEAYTVRTNILYLKRWEAKAWVCLPYLEVWNDHSWQYAQGKTAEEAIDNLKAKLCRLCARSDAAREKVEAYDATRRASSFERSRDCSV